MRFPDADYLQRIETLTDQIEAGSAAEVVVTIASRSGNYRDVDLTWAAISALLTLLVLVLSPLEVSELGLVPNLVIAFGLGFLLSRRVAPLRRLLTSAERRHRQVASAARVAFLHEALDATPGRVGLLIYLSLFEREVEIVADHGLVGVLGLAPLHTFRHAVGRADDARRLDAFVEAFEQCGEALKAALPATAETVHGIPNRPRVVTE